MQTLPRPLPDELLYSTLARATYRYGFWSPKRFLDVLYGRRTVVAVPDLPSNLRALVEVVGSHWQLDLVGLVNNHTLFRYYTHFLGQGQRTQVLAAMATSGGSLQVRLGVSAGSARTPRHFHLCPTCHSSDIGSFGEPYWHRAHHLPGVLVCHLHGDTLLESEVSFRPEGRHTYLAAPIEYPTKRLQPLVMQLAQPKVAAAVAARSYELLITPQRPTESKPDYRSRLSSWKTGWGSSRRLRSAFVDYFGDDLLKASFKPEVEDPVAWLGDVLRARRRPLHPFKHVLMEVFLRGQDVADRPVHETPTVQGDKPDKRWGVYLQPELRHKAAQLARQGLTRNAIAKALALDWKTVQRLLAPLPSPKAAPSPDRAGDRQAWEQAALTHSGFGKKELRAIVPALYARLYRNDRAWLLAWQARPARPRSVAQRIDWSLRDITLEASVRQQICHTVDETPPRRATRNHVLGRLGIRALVTHHLTQLPRTAAALEALCETVETFQVRRLELVFRKEGTLSLPAWKALRLARIDPGRLHDGGKQLVELARQRARDALQGASGDGVER